MPPDHPQQLLDALNDAARRVCSGLDPVELVADIAIVDQFAADFAESRVTAARAAGAAWEEIARRLGVSRQAAHKRFASGRRERKQRMIALRIER
jgi:hypothetical protein